MIYKDGLDKIPDPQHDKSDRNQKRIETNIFEKYYKQYLLGYLDVIFWNNLSKSNKFDIIQLDISDFGKVKNNKRILDKKKLSDYIRENFKVENISKYRKEILCKL